MSLAALTLSGRDWLLPAAILAMALVAALAWSYGSGPGPRLRWLCAGLKLIGILALAFCLLDPLWTGERARPGANLFAVVADNSQGMRIKDSGASRDRGETLRDLLDPAQGTWPGELSQNFEVRRHVFDTRLQTVRDFSELTFEGRASAIGTALRSIGERFQKRPLAGVLLFTDGIATDLRGVALPDLSGLPPIYPVVIGSGGPPRDLAVVQARGSASAFEDAPVTLQSDVVPRGYRGDNIVARVVDRSGREVQRQTQRAREDGASMSFRFQLKPDEPGLAFYQVRVAAEEDTVAGAPTNRTAEATLANNSGTVVVDRGRGPHRILYVSGRPNWEFKFLNRAVQEDPEIELVGLIRAAKREPKFDFRGRAGETSNPLFRGFGNQNPEDVERYDQPVLIRLNTRDELELRGGFPRTPEELYSYQAVILDDLEAEFFTPDQALLLQKFVSERGGGFLMLGGMECFREGGYQRMPIGDMLPVHLDRLEAGAPPTELRFKLSREGLLQSWARLRDNEQDERARVDAMIPFRVFNTVREVKPGASVIATAAGEDGREFPALVVQRFGRGRTGALTVGDLWRWGLHDAAAHTDMDKAWRQLVRWLVTDTPGRVEMAAEAQSGEAGGARRLRVRVRDEKYQPEDNAAVTIEIRTVPFESSAAGNTNVLRLRAEPSLNEAGLYETTFVPRQTGASLATAFVTNSVGAEIGRAEAGWNTDLAAEEFRSLVPNTALLEAIAKKTGGEVITPARLAEFVHGLPSRKAPVMEAWSYPLWHTPAMFGFALACLLAEWGLRRWKGMA